MAGSTSNGGGDDETISGINVTPLVDVVLVLLIILMVTAQYAAEKDSIPMDLPQAASGDTSVPTTLSVSIDKDGRFYLDAKELTLEQMRSRVREAYKKDKRAMGFLVIRIEQYQERDKDMGGLFAEFARVKTEASLASK